MSAATVSFSSAVLESGLPRCILKLFSSCISRVLHFYTFWLTFSLRLAFWYFYILPIADMALPNSLRSCFNFASARGIILRNVDHQCFLCFTFSFFLGRQKYVGQGEVPQWDTDFSISGLILGLWVEKRKLFRKRSKSLTPRPVGRWRQNFWETSSGNSASTQQRMSCRWFWFHKALIIIRVRCSYFVEDLTIQVDPNASGVLKLPNLLDIMSKIVDDENHDGQIMDALKWAHQNVWMSFVSVVLTRMDREPWHDLIWSMCFL